MMVLKLDQYLNKCPPCWINFIRHYDPIMSEKEQKIIYSRVVSDPREMHINEILGGQYNAVYSLLRRDVTFQSEEDMLFFVLSWS